VKYIVRRTVGRRTFFYFGHSTYDSFGNETGGFWVMDPSVATRFDSRSVAECIAKTVDGIAETES